LFKIRIYADFDLIDAGPEQHASLIFQVMWFLDFLDSRYPVKDPILGAF
jgi:hypothetical protein